MQEERQPYHIYLLTVWQEVPVTGVPHWRYRLEDPQTGIECGFVTPQALPYVLQQIQHKGRWSDTTQD